MLTTATSNLAEISCFDVRPLMTDLGQLLVRGILNCAHFWQVCILNASKDITVHRTDGL